MTQLPFEVVIAGIAGARGHDAGLEQIVDEMLEPEARLVHLAEVGGEALEAVAGGILDQDLGIADDRVHRGAEILADMRQERDLQEVC